MSSQTQQQWLEANQRFLIASLDAVQMELSAQEATSIPLPTLAEVWTQAEIDFLPPPTLERLSIAFGLSNFEKKILLLCVGMELDAQFAKLVGKVSGIDHAKPSFSLALGKFSDAHWSALAPNSPLRYWNLVQLAPNDLITRAALKVDESILHQLAGVPCMDERLSEIITLVNQDYLLSPSQQALAENIARACARAHRQPGGFMAMPFVHIHGDEHSDQLAVALAASKALGCHLFQVSALDLPTNLKETAELARLWSRETILNGPALFVDGIQFDEQDKIRRQLLSHLVDGINHILFVQGSSGLFAGIKRPKIEFVVQKPTPAEQLELWQVTLGLEKANSMNGQLKTLVNQFDFSGKNIAFTSIETQTLVDSLDREGDVNVQRDWGSALWKACCVQTRPALGDLAQRIDPVARWEDIVLPEEQIRVLKEIAAQVKNKGKVYGEWGFQQKSRRGLGISALFAGDSGTGKTMASEVLANELELDLYRIDLSQVVNKYIGETEKNLKRIFDAAENGGCVLLFDEADALFGKRSEVKDSHDRYSNIEVSYLLQRMEAYKGLAVLTTNMRAALDRAFLRRIRFVVQFPHPDPIQRLQIWRRAFPQNMPGYNDLPFEKLAQLSVPGGNIRNIALNAAFLAAKDGTSVQLPHLLQAARNEYEKLEKSFTTPEAQAMKNQ